MLTLLMALACVAAPAQAAPTSLSLEYAVKATYLYKLAPFVDWPGGTLPTPQAPFVICVIGDDPFHGYLQTAVASQTYGTHPFEVRELDTASKADGCQILFIGQASRQRVEQILAAVSGKPVLTVTDSDIDAPGSIVHFVLSDGRVRFRIDAEAASRHQLAISAKLMELSIAARSDS